MFVKKLVVKLTRCEVSFLVFNPIDLRKSLNLSGTLLCYP